MANLSSLRSQLATSLGTAARVVYSFPNTNFTPPCLVLVPSNPYLAPRSIGGAGNRLDVSFDLTAIVNGADQQAALGAIETIMIDALNVLPAGTSCTSWSAPIPANIGGQELVQSQMQITVTTTTSGN